LRLRCGEVEHIHRNGLIDKGEFNMSARPTLAFGMLNADGDGRITRKEYVEGFDLFDTDDDGFITREEFNASGTLFDMFDKDGDGRISRREWEDGFDLFDGEKDGYISAKEFNAVAHPDLYQGWVYKRDPKWSLPWYSRKYFVVTHDGLLHEFRNEKERGEPPRASVACSRLEAERDTGKQTIDDEEFVTFTLWVLSARKRHAAPHGAGRIDFACETDAMRTKLIAAVEAGANLAPTRVESPSEDGSGEDDAADAAEDTEDDDGKEDSRGEPGCEELRVRVWTRGRDRDLCRADHAVVRVRADSIDLTALPIIELPADLRRLAGHTDREQGEEGVRRKVRGGIKRPRKGKVFDPLPPCPVLELAVASRVLEEVPEWVGDLAALEVLRLTSARLTSLPLGLARLGALTTLQLRQCTGLCCLPELALLTALQVLDLQGCVRIQELPASVCALRHLHTLNVHDCAGLRALPAGMSALESLLTLDGGSCKRLRALPEGLSELSRLRFLDLSAPWRAEGSARQEDGHEARDGAESKEQLEARLDQLLLASKATNPAVTSAKSLPPSSATEGTAHQRFLGDDPSVVLHTRPRTAGHQRNSAHAHSSPSAARAARARFLYSIAQV
jgi:hypothetical protein